MENKIKILIADDHPLLKQGLLFVLSKIEKFEIVGDASDGQTALDLIKKLKPDIAILDIQMPLIDGFEVAKIVIDEKLSTNIIFLTMFQEKAFIQKVFKLGIKGYVLKENAVIDIVSSIEAVMDGKFFLSPQVSALLLEKNNDDSIIKKLTKTESKILKLIAEQKTSKEIAAELFISINTVENHRSSICKKLGITGNSALLKFAMQNKN